MEIDVYNLCYGMRPSHRSDSWHAADWASVLGTPDKVSSTTDYRINPASMQDNL